MSDRDDDEPTKKRKRPDLPIVPIKSTADYQRMRLARLMANPDKPVVIPSQPKGRTHAPPPDFVRNIMGSSAGAGSGEFHVYRHLRRKEYARQKGIQEQARREDLEAEFRQKVDERQKLAEEKAAKRRAKTLKKKQAKQRSRLQQKSNKKESSGSSSSSELDDEKDKEDTGIAPAALTDSAEETATPLDTVDSVTIQPPMVLKSVPEDQALPVDVEGNEPKSPENEKEQ